MDVTREDLEGRLVREALPEELAEVVAPRYEAALEGDPAAFEETIDGRTYQFHFAPVRDDAGDVFAVTAMSKDVTERERRERELRDAKLRLEAATEAGDVGTWEWHVPDDRLMVDAAFASQFGIDPEAAREGVSLDRFLAVVHEADRERVEREIEAAVESCGEYEAEYRVRDAAGATRWVVARGRVECEDGEAVTFPGALTDLTERKEAERELQRRGEQLAALNNLNEVVREITGAVVEQSTREEIERTVCERLAASDSYSFAWIGDADASGTVDVRTEAGAEGYLDDVTITVDPEDERSGGPTGRALRTGETQVTHDVRADSRHDPWRGHIEGYGFRSSAAVPIVHEGNVYGVLNVYAERPRAFDGQEREVVDQLGEVVGHAIAAAERKRTLMSDELVELEFRIEDVFTALDVPVETDGTITLDHAVPLGDDEFLYYGTATPDAVDTVTGLVETRPHWSEVTFRSEGDPADFELRLSDPPVLSVVTSLGGYIERTVIEGGDYRMTIHLAPSVDVRRVIDAIEAAYPQARMFRRRQISRDPGDAKRLRRRLVTDLTDRQVTALETAYHAGLFEWPRDASGEDVAESIGVSPPTFHQHLRKAERKVFDAVFSTAGPE